MGDEPVFRRDFSQALALLKLLHQLIGDIVQGHESCSGFLSLLIPVPAALACHRLNLLFVMGFYLGRYGGSWGTVSHEVEQPPSPGEGTIKKVVRGDLVFVGVCQTCHQSSGVGIPGQYPPLVGSEWAMRDAETPIRIVLYGLEGPITVKGNSFNNKMPPFHDKLSDEEIAAVVTHIRSTWGNSASPVRPEDVEAIRMKIGIRRPWSAAELMTLRRADQP